jgi:prepilin-type N-terminal cleavage/methylation domain-containing protein
LRKPSLALGLGKNRDNKQIGNIRSMREFAVNRNHLHATKRRSAFTLIELLVVIAIIAILSSLIAGGVMIALRKGPEAQNRNDILQLSTALQKFHTKFSCYPPNKLKLCSNYASYGATQLDKDSIAIISTIWPNLVSNNPNSLPVPNKPYWTGINWANRTVGAVPVYGNAANPTTDILDGDQCLVFFLGGIPNGVGQPPLGFSLDPTNPAKLPTAAVPSTLDRLKFLDFDGARIQLAVLPTGVSAHGATNPFPSFVDAYYRAAPKPQPFIYFSSAQAAKRANGYDPAVNVFGVSPYVEKPAAGTVPPQFYMASQFQIISAGLDGQFGPGGAPLPATTVAGKDDMSNFSGSMLGVAP